MNLNEQLGRRIAQLLGEVIVHHAPFTASIGERTKEAFRHDWLEDLEHHTSRTLQPIIDHVLANTTPPPEIAHLLSEAGTPSAELGSFLQQFLVYGIAFQVGGKITDPMLQEVQNQLWSAAVAAGISTPLDTPAIGAAVVRGINKGDAPTTPVPDWAYAEAAESGVSHEDLDLIVSVTGEPPAPESLYQGVRRGLITDAQLQQGLREGDTRDEWIPFMSQLRYTTLSPTDMIRAAVQEQLPYDTAAQYAAELGLEPAGFINNNPDWFQIGYNIAGRPPGPNEWGRLAQRGQIPWEGSGPEQISFQQAIAESDIKTKYTDALHYLAQWWPAVSETKGLYDAGAITIEQAEAYWTAEGVPPELIAALTHQATIQQVEQERLLAKGNVLTLLYDAIITQDQAVTLLGDLGYQGQTAAYMIELTLSRRRMRALDMAIRKIGSYYMGWKLTETAAQAALTALDVSTEQQTELLEIWAVERQQPVRLPSLAQLGKAVKYAGLDFNTAVSKAQLLGYTAYDATLIIGAESETPPPNGYPAEDADPGVHV